MDTASLLRARGAELQLEPDEMDKLAHQVDERVVQAVLSTLLRYEDALVELAR